MKAKSKYYLGLIILLAGLFILASFSVVYCSLKGSQTEESKQVEYIMAFAYLFIHIFLVLGVAFFAIKGYAIRPAIIPVIMTLPNGEKNKKSYRNCLVFAVIFGILGLLFLLESFRIFHLIKVFSLALDVALMNVGISVMAIAIYLFLFKPSEKEKAIEVKE